MARSRPGSHTGTMSCGICHHQYTVRSSGGGGYSVHKRTRAHVEALEGRGSVPFWLRMERKQAQRSQ